MEVRNFRLNAILISTNERNLKKGKGLPPRKEATCELPSECRSNETLLPNADRCGDYVYEDAERSYRSRHGGDGEVTRTTIKSRAKNSNERSIVRT